MKSKAILMALLAFSFVAQAEPVSQSDAGKAVRGWMLRNQERRHPGKKGRLMRIRHATTHETADGDKFHSFRMQGGGTVITSADTDDATVIAFTSKDVDFNTLDPKNPFWALIARDLHMRGKARAARRADRQTEENGRRWAALKRFGNVKATAASLPNAGDEGETEGEMIVPSDLRVPALVKSQWSQGGGIWNYYTPNGKDPDKFTPGAETNVVCGCVATAMSQLMRYHEYPTGEQTPVTRQCSWAGSKMKLTTQAGEYDWANMPYTTDEISTDAQRQAIGKLTSDAGISVYMMYNNIGKDGLPSGESGAFAFDIPDALTSVWGYGSAVLFSAGATTIVAGKPDSRLKALKRALFANFDAGFPTLMGVSGADGHQIVADGYGYDDDGVDYVHLNMGWAGTGDMWYHLPEIIYDEEAGAGFTSVDDIVYNVMPSGSKTSAILSGRVTDETGAPIPDAQVTVFRGMVAVTNALTSEYGVWGVPVAAGTYTVRADEPNGLRYGFCRDVSVKAPVRTSKTINGVGYKPGTTTAEKVTVRTATVARVENVDNLGNAWGNDVVLRSPTSMIVTDGGSVTNVFYSLEEAFATNRQYAAAGHPEAIDLLATNALSSVVEIDFDCTIRAAAEDGVLVFTNEAALAVTDGARLTLRNLVLSETTTSEFARICVAEGATVEIGDGVAVGGRIDVASADGFVLAGALASRLDLNCSAATQVCQAFGSATTEEAGLSASNIVNWADGTDELVGCCDSDGTLRWGELPLDDPEESVGSYEEGGLTVRSRSYDRLFAKHEFDGSSSPIKLEKDGVLSLPQTLSDGRNLTIGANPGVVVTLAPAFGFSVGEGCSLKVDGVSFSGAQGPGLFVVNGGSLALTDVAIDGAVGTNEWSGAVAVLKGVAGLTNVVIRNCRATGKKSLESMVYRSYGGGATVGGADAALFLKDCTIENCWAASEGGGIGVLPGGTLGVDGRMVVRGNTCGENLNVQSNDICFANQEDCVLVTGPLFGDRTVGVRYNTTDGVGNRVNDMFATVDSDGVSSVNACADVFFNDTDSGIEAVASGNALVWQAVKETYGTEERQPTSLVRVTDADGNVRYFDRIKYVPAETAEDEFVTVELLGDDTYPGDLAFACDVKLTTAAELAVPATLAGTGDGAIVLGENQTLTFGSLAFDGTVSRAPTAKVVLADAVGGKIAVDEATAGEAFGEVAPDFFAADLIAATNSAAKFTRSAPVATGLVATNGAGVALLVWSDAFSPDGKVIVDGETYYGIGDFGGEPPIPPSPIAFTSIVGDRTAGTWTVTFESAVEKCWYSLYETNSLVGGFEIEGVQPVARRPATSADVPAMSFTRPNDGSQLFWKVVAEPSDAYVVPGDLIPNP